VLANRREKIFAIVLLGVLGLLVMDQYVLSPYMAERGLVAKALTETMAAADRAQRLLDGRVRTNREWHNALENGLKTDPALAETQALNSVRQWADESRVNIQSLKPDRVARSGDFSQIRIAATGTTTTAAFSDLLARIETAKIPMRVNELRLASRKEGVDDLTFTLNVSTIVFTPAPEKKPAVKAAPKGEM
jgi:hypothetical protein